MIAVHGRIMHVNISQLTDPPKVQNAWATGLVVPRDCRAWTHRACKHQSADRLLKCMVLTIGMRLQLLARTAHHWKYCSHKEEEKTHTEKGLFPGYHLCFSARQDAEPFQALEGGEDVFNCEFVI